MKERITSRDYSFIIELSQNGHYSIPEYIDQQAMDSLRIMHDEVVFDYTTAFSYKTWPFSKTLNPLLSKIYEGGLAQIWEVQIALKYLDNNLQLRVIRSSKEIEQGPKPLSINQLLGAFGLLLLGHFFALLFFFGEKMMHRHMMKKRNYI